MSENEKNKFKTTKLTVKTDKTSENFYGINLITSSKSRVSTKNNKRLLSPIEAEKRKSQLMTSFSSSSSSIRKLRKPTNKLSLKSAPIIPTAPKSKFEIRKNQIVSHVKKHFELVDKPLLFLTLILCILGVFAVYSSTSSFSTIRYTFIQTFAAVLGLTIITVFAFFDYRQIAKHYRIVLLINAFMLLFTFFFGEGVTSETNANWLNLGFIKIQPSEFSKILFIYSFAVHLYYVKDRINKIFTALTLFLHAGLVIGLTLLQKDLGTLTVFLFIFAVMCFVGNLNIWYFITGIVLIAILSPLAWNMLNYYQQLRILVPFDPSIDPQGLGIRYQTAQSMTAVSLGGVSGSGYKAGVMTQGNLSAKHTDMIFSTICEEFGFIGGCLVLALYIYLIYRIIKIALSCDNDLGCLVCTGVAAMFVVQIVENIGMCLGIMPVIGITLPFISYGGSSALSTYIAIGLIVSVSTHKEKTFFR